MAQDRVVELKTARGKQMREPFVPTTGNPENGEYTDYYDNCREGEVTPFQPAEPKTAS